MPQVPRGTVLVVNAGCEEHRLCDDLEETARARCVDLDGDDALVVLRSDPFAITAVVLSGDGESPVTTSVLEAIKAAAPRIPVVFLDARESVDSELTIRRAGVHYYSHLPADSNEIASVLTGLSQSPRYGEMEQENESPVQGG